MKNSRAKRSAIKRIGLTGPIASGKSTFAQLLREKDIPVIDMDALAKRARERADVIESTRSLLPSAWDGEKKCLRPEVIRQAIVSDPEFRRKYEGILHPLLRSLFEEECGRLEKQGKTLVVCEAALMLQTGFASQFDEVLVMSVSPQTSQERLQARNPEISQAQIASWSLLQDTAGTGSHPNLVVIPNDGRVQQLKKQALDLLQKWKELGWLKS